VRPITDEDAIWIAGFFDGEGHVGITRTLGKKSHHSVIYGLKTTLTNTRLDILDMIRKLIGMGTLYKKSPHEGWKQGWTLNLTRPEIEPFLKRILPYLRLKKEQAKIMLEFLETGCYTGTREAPPSRIVALRDILYTELSQLNKTGA
jgi:hypothetical protein